MSDFKIVNVDPNTAVVTLGISNPPKKITGIEYLVQIVVLSYLRNPGRDVIDPNEGSGLRDEIGSYGTAEDSEAKLLAVQRTKKVEQEVISRQKPGQGLPSERLKKLTVLDVAFSASSSSLAIRVKLTNEAGDARDVII